MGKGEEPQDPREEPPDLAQVAERGPRNDRDSGPFFVSFSVNKYLLSIFQGPGTVSKL